MADQRVVITLNVNSRGSAQITALQKQLAALDRHQNKLNKTSKIADEYFYKLAHRTDLVSRTFNKMRSVVGTMVGIFTKFNAVLSVLAVATLPLLNAAFAAGRLAVKAYNVALQLLAVGVAAVGSAVAVGLAAFKEYNAALQSFAYRANGAVTSTSRASGAMRNLQRDAKLAVFGITGLNDAFAQVNQSSTFTGESQKMLRALADFAAAGGDPAKNIAAAGAFVGLLQKEGKLTQEVLEAGQKIGPQFAKALSEAKKKGMSSAEDLKRMLYAGDLALLGGVAGQADRVNQTLFAQFKRLFSEIMVIGTDLGDSMLSPAKKALGEIGQSMLRTLRRVAPAFASFGKGTFLDSLVDGFIKLEDILVNLFRKYLPQSVGMLRKFADWWGKVVFVFKNLRERMQPLLEAGRAIMDVFGPAFTQIFDRFGDKYGEIGKLIQDNREEFDRLGVNLERFVNLFFDFGTVLETAFAKALPIINSVAEAFMTIAETVLAIIRGLATLGSGGLGGFGAGIGGMAALYAMFAGKGLIIGNKTPGGGRRTRGVKGMPRGAQAAAAKVGGFNSKLGLFGLQTGGFFGINQVPGRQPVPGTPPSGMYMGLPYGPQGPRPLPWFEKLQRQADYAGKLSASGLGFRGRMGVMIAGDPEAGIDPMKRRQAFRQAMKQARGQRRYARGIAPTGLGTGIAAMLASQALMGQMSMANTGLGNVGGTLAQTGSMVAMFNPLAGLGLTLGGGALGAKTVGGGALAGAGAGAAFGTMVGGAPGAAVGAMLGGILGAVSGSINRFKEEGKKLRDAAKKRGDEVFGDVVRGFVSAGDFSNVKKQTDALRKEADRIRNLDLPGSDRTGRTIKLAELLKAGQITKEQHDILLNGVKGYVDGLDKQADSIDKVTGIIETGFNQKMSAMISITGKSQEEIMALANEIGVNLFDATLSTTDALSKMGFAMKATAEQVRGAIVDIQQNALAPLRREIEIENANAQIATLVQSLGDMGAAAGKQDVLTFGDDLITQLNILKPEDIYGNIFRAIDRIKAASAPGGPLASVATDLINNLLSTLQNAAVNQRGETEKYLASTIAQGFAADGIQISQADLLTRISGMSNDQISALSQAVASGDIYGEFGATRSVRGAGGTADIGEFFSDVGFGRLIAGSREAFLAGLSEQEQAMYNGVMEGIKAGFEDAPGWWNEYPAWWKDPPPDTSTPRAKAIGDTATSRLRGTLNKHRMIDSAIPGKRRVTSAMRNFNLGSINSDHVTGNAYDLTGQNLGKYAYTVQANGGLAEFHGWGSSRHLHVVPGMDPLGRWFEDYKWGRELAGKTGDTPTPAVPKMTAATSVSGATYNYAVNVNGTNADPNQIADAVINKIQRMERDRKERR